MNRGILGYGFGYIGQGASYCFMSTYFVLYMTNSVGMSPTLASFIMSFALLVEVVAGMLLGNLSDRCASYLGKRRPFVLFAAVSMPVILILLFTTVHFGSSGNFAYYLILSIMFRISFSSFEIPNGALGAEIATGYDQRTVLRTVSRIFSIIGNFIAYLTPLWILGIFSSEASGWNIIGGIVAVACLISWMTSFFATKGYGKCIDKNDGGHEKYHFKEVFRGYKELVKLKTMKLLIVYKATFGCAFALYNVATIYYLRYVLGLSNNYTSLVYLSSICVFIITTPLANKMAIAIGKSAQQKYMMAATAIIAFLVFFTAAETVAGAVIYILAFSVMQTTFWQLSPSLFYDIAEVDEYVSGKRREGDIVSMVSVLGTLISAIIVQCFGICFDIAGFDPSLATQGASVTIFLKIAFVLVPGICFTIGTIALQKFPINKHSFEILQKALACKREGEDYSMYEDEVGKLI